MCDYSLMHLASRPAQVGDKLVTKDFGWGARGFCAPEDANMAVCVLPGTEIAFDAPIEKSQSYLMKPDVTLGHKVAIFRQVNKDQPSTHHDALELPDGSMMLLTHLVEDQKATVLQLPVEPKTEQEAQDQKRLEVVR